MQMNDIIKKLKINGFVKSDFLSRMVHPKSTEFFVDLYYYSGCRCIEIGDRRNRAFLRTSSIKTFVIEPGYDGIYFGITLINKDKDNEIYLFCAFD